MGWIWILIPLTALSIPIIAILSNVVEKYIKAQERQADRMTDELLAEMKALKDAFAEQRELYEKRFANLEGNASAQAEQNQQALPSVEERYLMPDLTRTEDLRDDEKATMLAEKLKG